MWHVLSIKRARKLQMSKGGLDSSHFRHTRTQTHTHTYTLTHTHIHTHTQTYKHTHTHTGITLLSHMHSPVQITSKHRSTSLNLSIVCEIHTGTLSVCSLSERMGNTSSAEINDLIVGYQRHVFMLTYRLLLNQLNLITHDNNGDKQRKQTITFSIRYPYNRLKLISSA